MGVAQKATLTFASGDQSPDPAVTFKNRGAPGVPSTPRDLTGYTAALSYHINIAGSVGRNVVVQGDMSQASSGTVTFPWGPNDLDTPGTYDAQIALIDADGRAQTWNVLVLSVIPSTRS